MTAFDTLIQILKEVHSVYDLSEDISTYNENCEALNSQEFSKIIDQLEKSINKYGLIINTISPFTKVNIVHCQTMTYELAYNSLMYITSNIPTYVAFGCLKDEALEKFKNLLLGSNIGEMNAV